VAEFLIPDDAELSECGRELAVKGPRYEEGNLFFKDASFSECFFNIDMMSIKNL